VKRAAGFTLVEILLALVLMSMLLALAYGGLRASTRATDKGQAILEESGRIRMAHQFVRKQLNQMAFLAFGENQDDGDRIVFEGEINKIRFVAPMPGYLGFGGPQVQELALVSGNDGLELVLSHALLQGFEEQNLYLRDPIVLVDKIDNAQFSFLGRDEEGELLGWVNQWEQTGVLPASVSLDIEFTEEVYLNWPLLTASVRVDSSALQELVQGSNDGPINRKKIEDIIKQRSRRN
jgi:general secretion pathway protein J